VLSVQNEILKVIQAEFPIDLQPYAALANQLGSSDEEVITQIKHLKAEGIIRRIGAIFNAAHLGYVSTLIAAQIPTDKINDFVADVNTLPGVSHNYGRQHEFNIWFTLTMESMEKINQTVAHLRTKYHLDKIYNLPALKLYKIKVNFTPGRQLDAPPDFDENNESEQPPLEITSSTPPDDLSARQIDLIRQLQQDLPVIREPFHQIANTINENPNTVLTQIKDWKKKGLIRRFGASVKHQRMGFTANGMVVFDIEPERLDTIGSLLARYRQVSHCYHRPSAPDWPYNLFAMTHCRSERQLQKLVQEMVRQTNPRQYDILLTTTEHKKTNVKYFTE